MDLEVELIYFRRILMKIRNQAGMTLLEIMIVVIIVAGLFAVLGKQVAGNKKKANYNQSKIVLGEVAKALEAYSTDCGNYPTTDQGLPALTAKPGGGRACEKWGPEPYMRKVPLDSWNHDLVYTSEGSKFSLKSLGADGQEGGSGYDADIIEGE
jgi:general secretion pathway protein G